MRSRTEIDLTYVWENINVVRVWRKLTWKSLAYGMGVSSQALAVMNHRRRTQIATVEKVAAATKIPMFFLFLPTETLKGILDGEDSHLVQWTAGQWEGYCGVNGIQLSFSEVHSQQYDSLEAQAS